MMRWWLGRWWRGVSLLTLGFSAYSYGAVITTCDESSLRSALTAGGNVVLACDGTIVLSSEIVIGNDVNLDGSGHSVVLSGSNSVRLFSIEPGKAFVARNLTFADGCARGTNGNASAPGGPGLGGAVYNNGGKFEAHACRFIGNRALGGTGGSGSQPGGSARGGAIYNSTGELRFINATFSGNFAKGGEGGPTTNPPPFNAGPGGEALGGAVYNSGDIMRCQDSDFSANFVSPGEPGPYAGRIPFSAGVQGGAVYQADGQMTLAGTHLSRNVAAGGLGNTNSGGALYVDGGTVDVLECWFSDNQASGGTGYQISTIFRPGGPGTGGAIHIQSGSISLTNSAFGNNGAKGGANVNGPALAGAGMGGALWNAGNLQMVNATFHANIARGGDVARSGFPGGSGLGGAVYNSAGSVTLNHATIAGNSALWSPDGENTLASRRGSGVFSTNGTVLLQNSIVAYGNGGSNCFGNIVDGGYNLSSDSSCNFSAAGSVNAVDPLLGPFVNYGGYAPSMALLEGSPALNAALGPDCPPVDQRGRTRPFGPACDIGAFESSPPYTIIGRVYGYMIPPGITVAADGLSATTDFSLTYVLNGVPAGNASVAPTDSDFIYIPPQQSINLGPDRVGVNFKAYRRNALSIESSSNRVLHLVYAGNTGEKVVVEIASNLPDWTPYETNTVSANGLFDIFDSNTTAELRRFFRTVKHNGPEITQP
jgi:hypothetical protein